MSTSRPDLRFVVQSLAQRAVRLGASSVVAAGALALADSLSACSIPYPVTVNSGPLVVPPSPDRKPLGVGASVMVVTVPPTQCRYLGLGTGVGGVEPTDPPASPQRDAIVRARALVSLRNAVGDVGGSHVTVDAEEAWTHGSQAITEIVVRGGAFACR